MLCRLVQSNDLRCISLVLELMRDFNVEPLLKEASARILIRESYKLKMHLLLGAKICSAIPVYPTGYEVYA